MQKPVVTRVLLISVFALLLVAMACGPAATPTPTSGAPKTPTTSTTGAATPTIFVPPVAVLPTATNTPVPGVTAAPTPTPTAVPIGDQPKRGGMLRFATSSHVVDPVRTVGSNWSGIVAASNVWGTLIRVNVKDRVTVEPDMAASWTVSADGKTWKFKIRPGVLDHEGNPFTVQDAYWQMIRYIERPNSLLATRQSCLRSYVKKIWDKDKKPVADGGAEITGPDELTVRLIAPGVAFVPCFSSYPMVFQPMKYVKAVDTDPSGVTRDLDPAKGEYMGYGPFKFKEMKVDDHVYFTRNDKFFRAGMPYLDELQFSTITEQSTWEAGFSVGKLDFLGAEIGPTTISIATAEQLKKQLGANEIVFPKVLAMGLGGFDVNVRRPPFGPMGDPKATKIRTAMNLAINRGEINDFVFDGTGHLATPYFIGWDWIYSEKDWLAQYRGFDSTPAEKAKDILVAKKLMEEAGYSTTNRLKFKINTGTSGTGNQWSQIVARQLRDIYMDIEVVGLTNSTDVAKTGNFDLNTFNNGATFPDPDSYNTDINGLWEDGGQNSSGYTNPTWKELHLKQAIMTSNADRAPLLRQMARIWHDDATRIDLLRSTVLQGYRSYVKGWTPPPYHFIAYPFEGVWISK